MLEKQLSVPVRLIELIEFALHLIMPSLSHKKVVRNNAPEENDRDGMLHSTPRSPPTVRHSCLSTFNIMK